MKRIFFFFLKFYFILIFSTSRHQRFISQSCWHYHHPSETMMPSKLWLCHRHYTARPRCCIMTSLQHERRYVMTAIPTQPGRQKQVWPSHMLWVAPDEVINFVEFNQHSRVTKKTWALWMHSWGVSDYPETCLCCWISGNIVHDRPESVSSSPQSELWLRPQWLTHTITHYLLHFCAE